jgi:hypothetical protein
MTPTTPGAAPQYRVPIERFLGRNAAAGGPFALLELTPSDLTEDLIIVQLQRQLAKVAGHFQGSSLDADSVRLALHAAAAQLLEYAEDSRPTEGPQQLPVGAPLAVSVLSGAAPQTGQPVRPAPLASPKTSIPWPPGVAETIASYGGLNHRALERIAHIAATAGISPQDLIASIRAHYAAPRKAATRTPPPTANQAPAPAAPEIPQPRAAAAVVSGAYAAAPPSQSPAIAPAPPTAPLEFPEPVSGNKPFVLFMLIGGGGLALLLGAALLIAFILKPGSNTGSSTGSAADQPDDANATASSASANSKSKAPPQLFPAPAQSSSPATPAKSTDRPPPVRTARDDEDFSAVLRELSGCIDATETGPAAAVERFESLVPRLALRWVEAATLPHSRSRPRRVSIPADHAALVMVCGRAVCP